MHKDSSLVWNPPAKLKEIADAALKARRSFLVSHGEDTGGSPFVSFTAKWEGHEVRLTWHTRASGTYRLFSSMAAVPGRGWRDISAAKAVSLILNEAA